MDRSTDIQPVIRKLCPSCGSISVEHAAVQCAIDGTALVVFPQDAMIGNTVADRYHLLSLLGEGGWSTVYKADDLTFHRVVAVKVMQAHLLAHADRVMRFKREAMAISAFEHPNMRAIYDCGVLSSGQPFMAMEYLDGRTLSEVLQAEGSLSVRRVVDISIQVCDALHAAHKKGIIHRDVKPSNIMLLAQNDKADMVKVMDFGLAKFTDSKSSADLTNTGETVGTAAYMSPEQCLGKDPDGRSDIYSLGCVMYEAITGKKAIDGRANQCMLNHINTIPPRFSEVRSDLYIPQFLESIVFKALEKDPAARFQSLKEMSDALSTSKKVDSTRGRTATLSPSIGPSLKKNAVPVAAAALTLICLGYCLMAVMTRTTPSGDDAGRPAVGSQPLTNASKIGSATKTLPAKRSAPGDKVAAALTSSHASAKPLQTTPGKFVLSPNDSSHLPVGQKPAESSSTVKLASSHPPRPVHVVPLPPGIEQTDTQSSSSFAPGLLTKIEISNNHLKALTQSGLANGMEAAQEWETLGALYQKVGNAQYSQQCFEQAGTIKYSASHPDRTNKREAQQYSSQGRAGRVSFMGGKG